VNHQIPAQAKAGAPKLRNLLKRGGSRPVVFHSSHSPEECLGRLAAVTSQRGYTAFLDKTRYGLPDPRFRGEVGPGWFSVAPFSDTLGRDSFVPWVEARCAPSNNGATFTGKAGLKQDQRLGVLIITLLCALVGLVLLVVGIASGPWMFVILGLVFMLLPAGAVVGGLRQVERRTPKLLEDLNRLLDSTSEAA
jgi:hypothetical protein